MSYENYGVRESSLPWFNDKGARVEIPASDKLQLRKSQLPVEIELRRAEAKPRVERRFGKGKHLDSSELSEETSFDKHSQTSLRAQAHRNSRLNVCRV